MSEVEVQAKVDALRAMSPTRKLEIVAELWQAATERKLAQLRAQHPTLADKALRLMLRDFVLTHPDWDGTT